MLALSERDDDEIHRELDRITREARELQMVLDDPPPWLSTHQLEDSVAELREDLEQVRLRATFLDA